MRCLSFDCTWSAQDEVLCYCHVKWRMRRFPVHRSILRCFIPVTTIAWHESIGLSQPFALPYNISTLHSRRPSAVLPSLNHTAAYPLACTWHKGRRLHRRPCHVSERTCSKKTTMSLNIQSTHACFFSCSGSLLLKEAGAFEHSSDAGAEATPLLHSLLRLELEVGVVHRVFLFGCQAQH